MPENRQTLERNIAFLRLSLTIGHFVDLLYRPLRVGFRLALVLQADDRSMFAETAEFCRERPYCLHFIGNILPGNRDNLLCFPSVRVN